MAPSRSGSVVRGPGGLHLIDRYDGRPDPVRRSGIPDRNTNRPGPPRVGPTTPRRVRRPALRAHPDGGIRGRRSGLGARSLEQSAHLPVRGESPRALHLGPARGPGPPGRAAHGGDRRADPPSSPRRPARPVGVGSSHGDGYCIRLRRRDGARQALSRPEGHRRHLAVTRVSYLSVTYHPSGLALAFVAEREGRQSIWLSSNLGEDPKRLVFSKVGTEFGALEFSADG